MVSRKSGRLDQPRVHGGNRSTFITTDCNEADALKARLPFMVNTSAPDALSRREVDSASAGGRPVSSRAVKLQASGVGASGAWAVGAIAVGALAIGALAISRLAIKRLSIQRSHIGELEIDQLLVRRMRVEDKRAP
jgi:hypothetical protein